MKGVTEKNISVNELMSVVDDVFSYGDRMQMAYAWFPEPNANPEIIYVATMGSKKPFHLWRCPLEKGTSLPSSTDVYPLLGWYEREMMDFISYFAYAS
jgi:hypothetical protein